MRFKEDGALLLVNNNQFYGILLEKHVRRHKNHKDEV